MTTCPEHGTRRLSRGAKRKQPIRGKALPVAERTSSYFSWAGLFSPSRTPPPCCSTRAQKPSFNLPQPAPSHNGAVQSTNKLHLFRLLHCLHGKHGLQCSLMLRGSPFFYLGTSFSSCLFLSLSLTLSLSLSLALQEPKIFNHLCHVS